MGTSGDYAAAISGAAAGKRGVSPVVIAVAIGLLVLAAIGVALFLGCSNGANRDADPNPPADSARSEASAVASDSAEGAANASAASSEKARQSQAAEPSAHPAVFETESVRITMPESFADNGYRWSSLSTDYVVLEDANGSALAALCWAEASTREHEAKSESYEIGVVSHGSIGFPAYLRLNYLDSEGKSIYWGRDEQGTLATDYMGASLQDFVSWIELYDVNVFRPAVLKESRSEQAGDSNDGAASAREPFYGVWVSASKDYGEAQSMADELVDVGFDGTVFVTTDWSNLNSEPWYVVTAGCAKTEGEAQALCERVHTAGYGDAYVKHSGDFIG